MPHDASSLDELLLTYLTREIMATVQQIAAKAPVTLAEFDYIADLDKYEHEKPYYYSGPLHCDQEQMRSNIEHDRRGSIQVRDLRGLEDQLSLERHGFEIQQLPSNVGLTFDDEVEDRIQDYMLETSDWLKQRFQAECVLCYAYRVLKVS